MTMFLFNGIYVHVYWVPLSRPPPLPTLLKQQRGNGVNNAIDRNEHFLRLEGVVSGKNRER